MSNARFIPAFSAISLVLLNDSFSSVRDFRKKLTSNLSEEEINQLVSLLEKVALSVEKES